MTQVPEVFINDYQGVRLKYPGLNLFLIDHRNTNAIRDNLQTAHCLEIILNGTIHIQHAGCIRTLSDNDIIFRKRGNYQINVTEDYRSLVIFMDNPFLNTFLHSTIINLPTKNISGDNCCLSFKSCPFIESNCWEIIQNIRNPGIGSDYIIKHITYLLLLQLITSDSKRIFFSLLKRLVSNQMIYIDFFVESNFTKPLTLNDMAKMTGRSLSRFKKDFFDIYQETPIRWLFNRRLEYADQLIRNTTDTISMIAFASGFTNLSHFSKAYKLKYGHAPRISKNQLVKKGGMLTYRLSLVDC